MSSDEETICYFRNPVPSSIYPFIIDPNETLSLLLEINGTRPCQKRFPMEILLHVNEILHRENVLWKEMRDTWTPTNGHDISSMYVFISEQPRFDLKTMRHYIPPSSYDPEVPHDYNRSTRDWPVCPHMTSADFLYRLKCFFPDIHLGFRVKRSRRWAVLRHNKTGMILSFSENESEAGVNCCALLDENSVVNKDHGIAERLEFEGSFSTDAVRLLDAFTETVDASRRVMYYHPAAEADLPTSDEHYIAVPTGVSQRRKNSDDDGKGGDEDSYKADDVWKADDTWDYPIKALNPNGYRSLLKDLKYDTQSGGIGRLNSTVRLTTVISSALLLYRLLRTFKLQRCGKSDVDKKYPISSVWQIRLVHRRTERYVVFMDDRGLFDIRAAGDVKGILGDLKALVESLLR